MSDSNLKIEVSKGCVDYLVGEVETMRRRLEVLEAENKVMNNFFGMIQRIGDVPRQGYGEDRLYKAKREIEDAVETVKNKSN